MQEARFIALMLAREDALEAGEIIDVEAIMLRATDYALFLETDLTVEETAELADRAEMCAAQRSYDVADDVAEAQHNYDAADALAKATALYDEADRLHTDAEEMEDDADAIMASLRAGATELPGTGEQPSLFMWGAAG